MTTATTTQHNNDCLLGQGNYEYTPICQCNKCFVDPEDDTPEQPYEPIETTCTYCDDTYQCPHCRMDEAEKKLGKPLTAETIPGSTPIFFL